MNQKIFYHLEMYVYSQEHLLNNYFYAYIRQKDIIAIKQYLKICDQFPLSQTEYNIIEGTEFPYQDDKTQKHVQFQSIQQVLQSIYQNKIDTLSSFPKFPISPFDYQNNLTQLIYGQQTVDNPYYRLKVIQRSSVCWHRCEPQNITCDQCNQNVECTICHFEQTGHTSQCEQKLEPVHRHCTDCQQLHFLFEDRYYTINHDKQYSNVCLLCQQILQQGFYAFQECHIACILQFDEIFYDIELRQLKYSMLKYSQLLNVFYIIKSNYDYFNAQNTQPTYLMVQIKCLACGSTSIQINNNDLRCMNISCFSNKNLKILNERDITIGFLQKYFSSNTFRNDFTASSTDKVLSDMLKTIWNLQMYQKIVCQVNNNEQNEDSGQVKNDQNWDAWDEWEDQNEIFVTQPAKDQHQSNVFSARLNLLDSYMFGEAKTQNYQKIIQNNEQQHQEDETQAENQLKNEDFVAMFRNQMEHKLKNLSNAVQKKNAQQIQGQNLKNDSFSGKKSNSSMSINQPLSNKAVLNYPQKKRRQATESRSSSINSYFATEDEPSIGSESPGVDFDDL